MKQNRKCLKGAMEPFFGSSLYDFVLFFGLCFGKPPPGCFQDLYKAVKSLRRRQGILESWVHIAEVAQELIGKVNGLPLIGAKHFQAISKPLFDVLS